MHSAWIQPSACIASPSDIEASAFSMRFVTARPRLGPAGELASPTRAVARRELRVGHDLVVEPDLVARAARDELAGHQQLARVPEPDDARQEPRGAHVGARQADLREEEGDLRALARDAQVGARRRSPRPRRRSCRSSDATIGFSSARMFSISSQVMRVNACTSAVGRARAARR